MKQKKIALGVLVAALFVAAGVLGYSQKNKESKDKQIVNPAKETSSETATTTPTPPPPQKVPTSVSQDYTQAVKLYGASGYRIQFSDCHGTPGRLAIAKGAKFMLDNRDNKAHKIIVKSQTFNLKAYGFAIATAKDGGTYNITCDGGGAAELTVQ